MRRVNEISDLPTTNELSSTENPTDGEVDAFATDGQTAFGGVQRALAEMVAALPSAPERATDLQRILGVDYKLAWQVFNITRTTHPLAAAGHVPGPPSLKRLLAAAESVGVPFKLVRNVKEAVGRFDDVVRTHAGTRAAFDSMVAAACADESTEAIDLLHRRNAYRGNVHIWGLQVQTFYSAVFIRGSESVANCIDECAVNLKLGLRRHRYDVSATVYGYRHAQSNGDPAVQRVPLRPDAFQQYGAPLLTEFCTNPLPAFRTGRHADGWTFSELAGDSIGLRGAVDLCFAGVGRGSPPARDVDGSQILASNITFSTPAALAIADLLVHLPSFGHVDPELVVHRHMFGDGSPIAAARAQRLQTRDRIQRLPLHGNGPDSADVPRVAELLRVVASEVRWNPDEFELFRVRTQYPVLDSVMRLQFRRP